MKAFSPALRTIIFVTLASSLHAQDPVLSTPGTATWTTEATATGTKTVFTLTSNTVFDWQQLNVKSGSELVFNFVGGKSVVNFLNGTGTHLINGSVTSNGIVAFFSPNADLRVNGSIIAKGVTLATLNADADDFSDGNGYELEGTNNFNFLKVNGRVEATDGDVVLGGERVIVGSAARIQASQSVVIGGGRSLSVGTSGDRKLKENSGLGFVLHSGESRGSRIEVAAGSEIYNKGRLDAGSGRIFLEVGEGGLITNESNGVIVGDAAFDGEVDQGGLILVPDEGDAVPAVSEATLTLPKLTRPDGTKVNKEPQTINYSVPMSASSDAGRDSSGTQRADQRVAQNTNSTSLPQSSAFSGMRGRDSSGTQRADQRVAQNINSTSLLQRSSFFGMRGGSATVAKR